MSTYHPRPFPSDACRALFQLNAQILTELSVLPEDSAEYRRGLDALRLIRSFLARRGPAP